MLPFSCSVDQLSHRNASLVSIVVVLSVFSLLLCGATSAQAQISFAAPLDLSAGTDPSSVASADFDGDTELDLIVVNRTSDDAYLFLGDGFGGFTFASSFSVGNYPQGIVTADFDGDSNQDIASTSVPFNTGNLSARLGNGDGTFQAPFINATDDGPRPVAAADLDNDSILDVVATNATRGNLSVFLGDGDGTFGTEIRTAVGTISAFPTDLAIADFDNDTNLDIITSNAQSVDDSLGLLLGDGDGTFQAATAIATTCDRPESVVADDFDADGDIDVAVACFASAEVAILLGDGLGNFATPVIYDLNGLSNNPYWIMSVDIDNDGKRDLVTSGNSSFAVLAGNGDGTFAPPFVTATSGVLFGAVAEDFDGDGRTDLAFANFGQDEVSIYLNTTPLATVPSVSSPGTLLLIGMLAGFGGLAGSHAKRRLRSGHNREDPR